MPCLIATLLEYSHIHKEQPPSRRQFSIETLLWLTTVCAVVIATVKFFGAAVLLLIFPILALTIVVKCGDVAVNAGKGTQYVYLLLAAFIGFVSIPSVTPHLSIWISDPEFVIYSILFAVGCTFVFSAIVRGHWATRVLAGFVALPYILAMIGMLEYLSGSVLANYWLGR